MSTITDLIDFTAQDVACEMMEYKELDTSLFPPGYNTKEAFATSTKLTIPIAASIMEEISQETKAHNIWISDDFMFGRVGDYKFQYMEPAHFGISTTTLASEDIVFKQSENDTFSLVQTKDPAPNFISFCDICNPEMNAEDKQVFGKTIFCFEGRKPLVVRANEDISNTLNHHHPALNFSDRPGLGRVLENGKMFVRILAVNRSGLNEIHLYDILHEYNTFELDPRVKPTIIGFAPPSFVKYLSYVKFGDCFPCTVNVKQVFSDYKNLVYNISNLIDSAKSGNTNEAPLQIRPRVGVLTMFDIMSISGSQKHSNTNVDTLILHDAGYFSLSITIDMLTTSSETFLLYHHWRSIQGGAATTEIKSTIEEGNFMIKEGRLFRFIGLQDHLIRKKTKCCIQ